MDLDTYLIMVGDKVYVDNLGPVIDLTGIGQGLECVLGEEYGSGGDQTLYGECNGTLRRNEEGGFAFQSVDGRFNRSLTIGDLARKMVWGYLKLDVPIEHRYLSSLIDCFQSYYTDPRGAKMCVAEAMRRKHPEQFYKGFIR